MDALVYHYQHLPYYLNPVAFSAGFFSLDWYSLMYLVGFGVVYLLLGYRIKRGEGLLENQKSKIKNQNDNLKLKIKEIPDTRYQILDTKTLLDFLFYIFFGLVAGARLGYVLFYNFSYYSSNPLAIISPFDLTSGEFIGIYGMSYHGGLIGVILASLIFVKIYKINFWQLADFVVPAVPAGYFFGRIGNFLNGELYGRVTEKFWGMYFSNDSLGLLRHPSQLYEAFLEGLVLFIILWKIRNNEKFRGKMLGIYVLGYAVFRIIVEFFREPDAQIGYLFGLFTLGQILSFLMIVFGLFLVAKKRK